jgi:hypothetical protein
LSAPPKTPNTIVSQGAISFSTTPGGLIGPTPSNISLINGPDGTGATVTDGVIEIADPNTNSWYEMTFGAAVETDGLFQLFTSTTNATGSYTALNQALLDMTSEANVHTLTVIVNVTNNPTFFQVRSSFNATVTLQSNNATSGAPTADVFPVTAFITIRKLM